jgi:aldose 1-epimerase
MRRPFLSSIVQLSVLLAFSLTAFADSPIQKKKFGTTTDGQPVYAYTLSTPSGSSMTVITYGGIITQLNVPDKNGKLGDVVLGFDNMRQYEMQSPYFGAIIGRYANRIANGEFKLGSVTYKVPTNNGPNMLHGGFKGYDKRIWSADTAITADGPSIKLSLVDPDGCEGFPGTVRMSVIYSLTADNTVKIQYFATADKPTPVNFTNHSYFNLKDGGRSPIFDHVLQLMADHYLPVNSTLIPTGEIASVKGTPIDFTSAKPIGRDLKAMGGKPEGYDHNLCLNSQDGSLSKAAVVDEPTTGRHMEVWTTEPGLQLYSGNFLDGTVKGKGGVAYQQHSAFALEAQHYPDSPSQPNFPSTILKPGQVYRQITEYRLSVNK